jgi:adenine-specific DNA-methyltransferase
VHIYGKSPAFDKAIHTPLLDGIDSFDTHYSLWLNDDGTLGSLGEVMLSDEIVGAEIRRYGFSNKEKFSVNNMDKLLSVSDSAKSFIDENLNKIARIDRPPVSAMNQRPAIGYWEAFQTDHRTYFLTTLANGTLQALMPLSLNYRLSDDYKPRFGRTVIRGDLWKGFHQDMGNVAKEGDMVFANGKKPVRLIKQLLKWAHKDKTVTILDFFSGSATTAHAVMQLNAEDGGKRRHIMVQLPEPCDEKSEAYKAGYQTIAEIGKERIRRAGQKILSEWHAKRGTSPDHLPLVTEHSGGTPPDIGFRVLKIDSSNFRDVTRTPDELDQAELSLHTEHIKPDRTPQDLLFQVLVDWGVDLALPIREEKITAESTNSKGKKESKEYTVYWVDDTVLAACFDAAVPESLIHAIAARKPLRAVFRDESYDDDSTRINVEQIFKLLSPNTEVKSL